MPLSRTLLPISLALTVLACGGRDTSGSRVASMLAVTAAKRAPLDFKSTISDRDSQVYTLYLSMSRQRFRLEHLRWTVIGPLDRQDWAYLLDPDTETYRHFSQERIDTLRAAGEAARASRLKSATSDHRISLAHGLVRFPFSLPCERAEQELGEHSSCEVEHRGPIQIFKHRQTSRTAFFEGNKKQVLTAEHEFDTRHGLLIRQTVETNMNSFVGRGPSLGGIELIDLPAELFEPPAHYSEQMGDEELAGTTRGPVGFADMLPWITLQCDKTYFAESKTPPAPGRWNIVRERWTRHGASGPDRRVVKINSAVTDGAADLTPPFEVSWDLKVRAWDPTPEVGDHSWRVDDTTLVFAADDRLYRVEIWPDECADQLIELGEALIERGR